MSRLRWPWVLGGIVLLLVIAFGVCEALGWPFLVGPLQRAMSGTLHRDVRFSADKSPYKTHQGGFVRVATRTGWYAEVSADGFRLGGGCYHLEPAALAAFREAVDGRRGARLQRVVQRLVADGWELGGTSLKTAPRGYPRDHERIELLRRKALTAMRWIEDGDVVTTPALVGAVREHWREVRPLVEWLRDAAP